ncbi:hypothetical protein LRY65_01435 [Candidatus Woesebacteria bacterium]|nr:hypothetical protein [Candidatus Woesebacteria bacterium]MCD8507452.1 hypothetical protein [Candidatus Woesebacteria bacterium]MCD8526855.1 hypothetical protein [Candidatus Woesebacteria bacterium]MCD8545806.1 hypothetical protein [Candidatus Woesebacteria bacterium]
MAITPETQIVLDIDETLVDSTKRHHSKLSRAGRLLGWTDMPNLEDFLRLGGSHGAFGQYPGYFDLNARMCAAEWFNRNMEVLPEALEVVTAADAMVAFYLTTRPDVIAALTAEELEKHGYPQREVICRPADIPVEDTTPWKLSVLKKKASELGKPLLMIDDSVPLHQAILEEKDPNIYTILYAGVRTPRGNGEKTWGEIQTILKNLR